MAGQLPRRVLLIDDNADAAKMLSALLGKIHGHKVKVAHDGESGLRLASEFRPELVFIDVGLPQMSGYQVAHALREDVGLQDSKLVALTGFSGAEEEAKAANAGMDQFLVKPPDLKKIEAIILDLPAHDSAESHDNDSLAPLATPPTTHSQTTSPDGSSPLSTKKAAHAALPDGNALTRQAQKESAESHQEPGSMPHSPREQAPPARATTATPAPRHKQHEREALGALFQAIAHDLGNHLSSMQLLLRQCDRAESLPADEAKETIGAQMPLMEKWISHLRRFSSLASAQLQPRMMAISVATLMSHAVAQCSQQHPDRIDDIQLVKPARDIVVPCDPGMVQEAFVCLVSNALEQTSPSQPIRIAIDEAREGVQIELRDEGKGLAEEWLPSVLGLFVRAGERPDPRAERFGVGLPFVEQVLRAHGGSIDVSSPGPGKGCTVRLWLPR